MTVEFRVLGQIEVLADGRTVNVGHARQRSVLAVLLVEANRVVAVDQLIERLWGTAPAPKDPRSVLRTYVWHLRRALAAVGDNVTLLRHAPGYKLIVDSQQVDLHRFRGLLTRAATANDNQAATLIEQALGLWHGEPFAGLDTPWISATRQNLLLRRQMARLDLTDIHLRHGRHTALLAELTDHAAEHPLDERIAGQLMLALHRSGRPAEALTEYQRVRKRLVDELGVDPGSALQQLHQQILTANTTAAAVIPRQLPAAPRPFTGRTHELARLSAALDQQADRRGTPPIAAISGAGGIGKTWLALHWAHQNLDRFPNGQLYVNLCGFDPFRQPMPAETAVRGFLDALGVVPTRIPADLDAQVGRYRSLLADKRILIVADNVRDTAQVIPLLPGSPTCTVLVTSRHRLTSLITGHGAVPMDLDMLGEDESQRLLVRKLGHDRVTAEPNTLAVLLECCAGLPLALSIVAARALIHPDLPLAVLADELRDTSTRLDALTSGDLRANVYAAISWSYDALGPAAARALCLIALAPGPDIGLSAVTSLLACSTSAARRLLRDLEDASLLQQHTPGRYRMHDLVRLYATIRAEHDQTLNTFVPGGGVGSVT
jgi:DNA-binding SARP family transcriptional activator